MVDNQIATSIRKRRKFNKPSSTTVRAVLSVFLNIPEEDVQLESFASYQGYYNKIWFALAQGEQLENLDIDGRLCVPPSSFERSIVEKPSLPSLVNSIDQLNRKIELAVRLWLVLSIRDGYVATKKFIAWDDTTSLQEFMSKQFRKPKLLSPLNEKMFDFVLPDNFTVVKVRRYSGIDIEWTSSLSEHLDLNRENRTLKIFRMKHYVYGLRKSKVEMIPNEAIDEYIKTMNLLFPSSDPKTQKFFRKRLKKQSFGMEGPVGYPGPLYLSDFHFWRDRLSNLYAEFCQPPPSMTQLFNDRRNVLQWYTFWFAVLIVGLTLVFGIISSVTAGLSTKFAYEALLLAREAADSSRACPPVACGFVKM
ncbi:hypothetical protein BKA61DRAFT_695072 [Leptodontidium sp. MPI-SDFR-AT-0119]|nr:hypothetical protein BKA61DRAFT_695072 [Leptodontidium sp. MPI-SDFR-AT-0119]